MLRRLGILFFLTAFFLPSFSYAQEFKLPNPTQIFEVTFDDITKECTGVGTPDEKCEIVVPWIGQYISRLYMFAVSLSTILAVVVIMVAGLIWTTAGGNQTQVVTAKNYISGAVLGLILMLGSYTILYLINPELVKFDGIRLKYVPEEVLEPTNLSTANYCSYRTNRISRGKDKAISDLGCSSYYELENESSIRLCGETPDTTEGSVTVCCCKQPTFQTGIEKQIPHASPELNKLLTCIQEKHPITINSISDSDIFTGNCKPWEDTESYNDDNNCIHKQDSAHYGGKGDRRIKSSNDTEFSCAADIDDTLSYSTFRNIVINCDSSAYTVNESSHYHVSVPQCGVN